MRISDFILKVLLTALSSGHGRMFWLAILALRIKISVTNNSFSVKTSVWKIRKFGMIYFHYNFFLMQCKILCKASAFCFFSFIFFWRFRRQYLRGNVYEGVMFCISCKPGEHLWSHGSMSSRAINDLNPWITAR